MKRINREVSIFNLSMMDVISGAMGAFLILVVILSRHYDSEVINTQRILDLQKELVEATGSLSEVSDLVAGDTTNTDLIERSLQAAKDNVARSKQYLNQIYEELQQANATIEQQEEEIDALTRRVSLFKPYLFMTLWRCDTASDVDIYLWTTKKTKDEGEPAPAFNPNLTQRRFFSEELVQGLRGLTQGMEVWSDSVSAVNSTGKLYYRINTDNGNPLTNCSVRTWLVTPESTVELNRLQLSPARPWIYVGEMTIDEDQVVTFTDATDQERAAEHAEVMARQ